MADRPTGPNAAGREDTVAIPRPQTTGTGTNGTGAGSGAGSGAAEGAKVLPPMPAGQGGSSSNGTNGQTKPRPARRPVKKTSSSTAKTATPKPASPRPTSPPPGVTAAAPAASAPAPVAPPAARPTATTTAPVVPAPVPVPTPAPAPQRPPKPSRDERRAAKEAAKPKPGRKARLRLTRVDPWSVMKTAFLLSIALGVVTVVCVLMVWSVLGAADVWSSINKTVQDTLGQGSSSTFNIEDYIGTRRVVGFTMIVAAVDVVLVTAICTLGAFLYNMSASLLGGIEVTLAEDN